MEASARGTGVLSKSERSSAFFATQTAEDQVAATAGDKDLLHARRIAMVAILLHRRRLRIVLAIDSERVSP
jgi:tetraacyldisaccharide-1-P 4'-kinase